MKVKGVPPWLTRVKPKLTFCEETPRNSCPRFLQHPHPHPVFWSKDPALNSTQDILSTYFKLNTVYFLLGLKVDYILSLTFKALMT